MVLQRILRKKLISCLARKDFVHYRPLEERKKEQGKRHVEQAFGWVRCTFRLDFASKKGFSMLFMVSQVPAEPAEGVSERPAGGTHQGAGAGWWRQRAGEVLASERWLVSSPTARISFSRARPILQDDTYYDILLDIDLFSV